MIYLDVNAFYWYFGREKLPMPYSSLKLNVEKFRSFLDSCDNKSIPTSVLMEMIVHFRNYPKIISEIISFCYEKNIKILNNSHDFYFTTNELSSLHITKNDAILKQYAYKMLEKKMNVEINHTYVFLQVVSLLYADYYLKSNQSLSVEIKDKALSYLGNEISAELKDEYLNKLKLTLIEGYEKNKEQQFLKDKYIELLVQNCVVFQMIIDAINKYTDEDQNLYEVMCISAQNARNNGLTDDGIMSVIVKALAVDSEFRKDAEKEIANIFKKKGYSEHQSQYIQQMLAAWLERGQKLKKNDIFDMLCVGVLDKVENNSKLNILVNQCPYLISFDETMMKFICRDSANANLIKQFML